MPHLHAQLRLVKAHQHVDNVKPRGRLILLMDSSNECTQGLQRWEKEFFLERKSQNEKGTSSVASHYNLRTFSSYSWQSTALCSELQNTVGVLICAKSRHEKRTSIWNCNLFYSFLAILFLKITLQTKIGRWYSKIRNCSWAWIIGLIDLALT